MESFPSLTKQKFSTAASKFQDAFSSCRKRRWRSVEFKSMQGEPVLIITRDLLFVVGDVGRRGLDEDGTDNDEIEDEDDEALVREVATSQQVSVEYHIVLSPSYQVPILYFSLKNLAQGVPETLDTVFRYLVPKQFQGNLQAVGVIGGISKGYHPISNIPMFFIHPCNTADALAAMAADRKIDPTEYLLIWMGIVGSCVDLCVPSELAERLMRKT